MQETIRAEMDVLPDIYDRRIWAEKVEQTFRFVFEHYSGVAAMELGKHLCSFSVVRISSIPQHVQIVRPMLHHSDSFVPEFCSRIGAAHVIAFHVT